MTIHLKTAEEIERMRIAGQLAGEVLDFVAPRVKPGITTGELLKGVRYEDVYAYTQSMVLRSASGTMRIVDAYHPIDKLRAKGLLPEQVAIP